MLNIEALTGSRLNDALLGDGADNVLRGLKGRDWLEGGDGDDLLVGGLFADMLIGGDGQDTAAYTRSVKGIVIDLGLGIGLRGEAYGDTLIGIENVTGSAWGDTIRGDVQGNTLRGLSGRDHLLGDAGNDILIGGLGDDRLAGGADADIFVFKEDDFGQDTIVDFQDGIDAILGVSFDDLSGTQIGADAVLSLISDPTQSITLLNTLITDIDASDFL